MKKALLLGILVIVLAFFSSSKAFSQTVTELYLPIIQNPLPVSGELEKTGRFGSLQEGSTLFFAMEVFNNSNEIMTGAKLTVDFTDSSGQSVGSRQFSIKPFNLNPFEAGCFSGHLSVTGKMEKYSLGEYSFIPGTIPGFRAAFAEMEFTPYPGKFDLKGTVTNTSKYPISDYGHTMAVFAGDELLSCRSFALPNNSFDPGESKSIELLGMPTDLDTLGDSYWLITDSDQWSPTISSFVTPKTGQINFTGSISPDKD